MNAAGPSGTAAGGLFTPAAFAFLRGLRADNTKAWFEAHRAEYERDVKQPVAALVAAVTTELTRRGLPLEGDPKRSTFRIHRDTRFSKDKSPYKTTVGAVWHRQGSSKGGAGVLYFHLDPDGCFAAAAFYMPEPEVLDALRERIRVHPQRWEAVVETLAGSGLQVEGDALTRMPRGFEDLKDSPVAGAIRQKSYVVRQDLPEAAVMGADLPGRIATLAAGALPLLQFGWAAVDEAAG